VLARSESTKAQNVKRITTFLLPVCLSPYRRSAYAAHGLSRWVQPLGMDPPCAPHRHQFERG